MAVGIGDELHVRSLATGVVVMTFSLAVLVLPLNSRLETVKPCGEELDCSVPSHKSLLLSLADLPAPFDDLNWISVPALALAAVAAGVTSGAAVEGRSRRA